MFLESLALDVEDFRLSLARGLHFPAEHDGVSCLSCMLSFVETGCYHPLWHEGDFPDVKGHEKAFEICKGAMIKAIVEVSGEEKNEDVLWDEEDPEKPGANRWPKSRFIGPRRVSARKRGRRPRWALWPPGPHNREMRQGAAWYPGVR